MTRYRFAEYVVDSTSIEVIGPEVEPGRDARQEPVGVGQPERRRLDDEDLGLGVVELENGLRVLGQLDVEEPTLGMAVVADVDPGMRLMHDELFGPAITVAPADDVDHALDLVNGGDYGLAAAIFTENVADAMRFAGEARTGNVHINSTPLWRADFMPYGGVKGSGIGKEGPRYAVEEMTELKTVIIHGLEAR